jgi:hypothetical protein
MARFSEKKLLNIKCRVSQEEISIFWEVSKQCILTRVLFRNVSDIELFSWIDHVRNEEVLLRVNEQKNILHEIRKRKAKWIGHILRRNCLLKAGYRRKDKGRDGSDKKTRKKT